MKCAISFVSVAVVLVGLSGCCNTCGPRACGPRACGSHCCAKKAAAAAPAAASMGAVAYPYYTVRGPRDFLDKNPPSIGP